MEEAEAEAVLGDGGQNLRIRGRHIKKRALKNKALTVSFDEKDLKYFPFLSLYKLFLISVLLVFEPIVLNLILGILLLGFIRERRREEKMPKFNWNKPYGENVLRLVKRFKL